MAFKKGVRKNNSDVMMAIRTVFTPLFFCGHHPKYLRLLVCDMLVNYPDEVAVFNETKLMKNWHIKQEIQAIKKKIILFVYGKL